MRSKGKPIIGIVLKHFLKEEVRTNMFVRDEIKQSIFDNGGIAIGIILPKDERIDVEDNGYIDGLESPDKTFYMAFRFHPESLYKTDENHNKIFKEFVKICKRIKNEAKN